MSSVAIDGAFATGEIYRCESGDCPNIIQHPPTNDCGSSDEGMCIHLVSAGWVPVSIRILAKHEVKKPYASNARRDSLKERHVITRGGWFCANCAKEYGVKS